MNAVGGGRRATRCILVFGAGNIGLSFVGQIFARSGWRVVFVDAVPAIVERLQRDGRYFVDLLHPDGSREQHEIGPVSAIDARDRAELAGELGAAPLIATCVGARSFALVLQAIEAALGDANRSATGASGTQEDPTQHRPPRLSDLDIIAAENMHDPRTVGNELFGDEGPAIHPCSVGKMVPIQSPNPAGPLVYRCEAYNTLLVDGEGWRSDIPSDIPWLSPVRPIEAWIDRKLYVHNLGHAVCAWRARATDPGLKTIPEAIAVPKIRAHVERVMRAAAAVVGDKWPGVFTRHDLESHVDDLLTRFGNRALGDTTERVGRDVARKLSRDERLVGALRLAAASVRDGDPNGAGARLLALGSSVVRDALAFDALPAMDASTETAVSLADRIMTLAHLDPADETEALVIEALRR